MARTPKDELKLAAMIAAVKARGLTGGTGSIYADGAVCAIGALHLASGATLTELRKLNKKELDDYSKYEWGLASGNDTTPGYGQYFEVGSVVGSTAAFDIGSAFRDAMTLETGDEG